MNIRFLAGFLILGLSVGCSAEPQQTKPDRESRRGESCAASNDCGNALACINQRCIQDDFPVKATAKECYIVECDADADCCDDFVELAACASYRTECDAGDTVACEIVTLNCECNQVCTNDRCTIPAIGCAADTECASAICEGGSCVGCRADTDCLTDQTCQNNFCTAGCSNDEECALFSSCVDSVCEETGCTSNRECILFTGDALAKCDDKSCNVPCTTNAQCGDLQLCEGGSCVFLGCEDNIECRAYFSRVGTPLGFGQQAVCRDDDD